MFGTRRWEARARPSSQEVLEFLREMEREAEDGPGASALEVVEALREMIKGSFIPLCEWGSGGVSGSEGSKEL